MDNLLKSGVDLIFGKGTMDGINRAVVNTREAIFGGDDDTSSPPPQPSPPPKSSPKKNRNLPILSVNDSKLSDVKKMSKDEVKELLNYVSKNQSAILSASIQKDKVDKKKKTKVGQLISDFFTSVKEGFLGGVKNGAELVVDKATGLLIKTPGVQGATDSISDLGNEVIEKSITKFFKKNWFYILLPIAGLFVFFKFINTKNKRR